MVGSGAPSPSTAIARLLPTCFGQPRQPHQHQAGHGPRSDRRDGVCVRSVRTDALGFQCAQQLAQQQRIPGRRPVAGRNEEIVGRLAQPSAYEGCHPATVSGAGQMGTVPLSCSSSDSSASSTCCSPVRRSATTSTGSPSSRRASRRGSERPCIAPLKVIDGRARAFQSAARLTVSQ